MITEFTQDCESRLLEGTNKILCHQDPGERSSNPTETAADLPVNVQESLAEVCARDLLKEVAIMVITSTRVWSQVKQQVQNTAPPINRKLD